jgi:uncharacterized RDD family membrane protein YckC
MTTTAPDDLGIVTGEAVALDVRPTGFVLRAAGAILDWLAEVLLFVGLLLAITAFGDAVGSDGAVTSALVIVALVVSFVIAPTVVETATRGRSLGKLAVGARIVRDDGGAITARHAFVRALTGVVEVTFTFGSVAALVGLFNRKAKRLGDLLAGTVSQHERVPRPPVNAVGVPEPLLDWSARADVARLPDGLSRRIATFLAQAGRMAPESRARLAAALAAEAAPFVSPLPETDPELLLAGVAALRRERELRALTLERERFGRLEEVLTRNPHGFPDR